MRILAIDSQSIDHITEQLQKFGLVFSVDREPDFRLPYDSAVGRITEPMWSTVKEHATTVVLEFPDAELAERIQSEYTCIRNGNVLSVLLHFGKSTEQSDLVGGYPCDHRPPEPVRVAECLPCQTLTGSSSVPIFRCSLFDCECSVASREIAGEGKVTRSGVRSPRVKPCTTCKDRTCSSTS